MPAPHHPALRHQPDNLTERRSPAWDAAGYWRGGRGRSGTSDRVRGPCRQCAPAPAQRSSSSSTGCGPLSPSTFTYSSKASVSREADTEGHGQGTPARACAGGGPPHHRPAHRRAAGVQPPAGRAARAGGAVDRPSGRRLGAAPLAWAAVPGPGRLLAASALYACAAGSTGLPPEKGR